MKAWREPYPGPARSAPLIHVLIAGRELVYSPYTAKRLRKVDEPQLPRAYALLGRIAAVYVRLTNAAAVAA